MRQLKGLIRLVKGGGLFGCSPASRERESEKRVGAEDGRRGGGGGREKEQFRRMKGMNTEIYTGWRGPSWTLYLSTYVADNLRANVDTRVLVHRRRIIMVKRVRKHPSLPLPPDIPTQPVFKCMYHRCVMPGQYTWAYVRACVHECMRERVFSRRVYILGYE